MELESRLEGYFTLLDKGEVYSTNICCRYAECYYDTSVVQRNIQRDFAAPEDFVFWGLGRGIQRTTS